MMIEQKFLWIQAIGLIALLANMLVWQIKKPEKIILMNVPVNFLWGVQFFLLGGLSGVATNFIGILKDLLIYFGKAKASKFVIPLYLILLWSAASFVIKSPIDALPFLAVTSYNICLFFPENRALIARGMVFAQIVWFSYDIYILSIFGAIACAMIAICAIIGMYRHEKWELGNCYKSFLPNVGRSLFSFNTPQPHH